VLERVRNEARVKTEEVRDAAAAAAIAEDDAAELTIRAPIDGTVVRLALRPGEVAAPGVPILRVAALDTIVAEVRVAETAVAALEANGAVELVLDAFPGRTFQGRLLRVSEAPADPARVNLLLEADGEKAFVATIAIDDPPVGLRPGLSVAARLSGRRAGAITVPREALFFEAGRRCIRVMEGGVPVTREVRVGLADGSRVEISGGLRAGDVVYLGR
jgi:membrane fusion protein (multidrug efflux system)